MRSDSPPFQSVFSRIMELDITVVLVRGAYAFNHDKMLAYLVL
jgi:hypothetical protein